MRSQTPVIRLDQLCVRAVLTSLLFWGTVTLLATGYFSVGLLLDAFAKNQAAPNLLSFAYMLFIGALNLLASRLGAFQLLSPLTFAPYGLTFTLASPTHHLLSAVHRPPPLLPSPSPTPSPLATSLLPAPHFALRR